MSRREAILDIAALSFAQQGFHGVSMRDIAKANDSSVATLYNHFTGKDALLLEIGRRFFDPFIEQLAAAATGPEPGLARVLNMVRTTFINGARYRNEFMTLSQDKRHIAVTAELRPLAEARNECAKLWEHALRAGMDDGSVDRSVDPAAIIWIVFSALTGIIDDLGAAEYTGPVADPAGALCALLSDGLPPRR